jgi:hypothetical protein
MTVSLPNSTSNSGRSSRVPLAWRLRIRETLPVPVGNCSYAIPPPTPCLRTMLNMGRGLMFSMGLGLDYISWLGLKLWSLIDEEWGAMLESLSGILPECELSRA